jgi:ATP-dependent DNA helicase DinG
LPHSLPYTVLVQGEAPREQLVEQFCSDTHSVLLGTASFRQGIDVPGEALSLVIVDKLPFAVPDDPLVAARADLVRRRGGDPFREDQLPEAILDLRQALGRLIRTRTDRGLLALLDVRVRTRPYGREVLRSLPPWPLIEDLEQARNWLRHI